MRRESDRRRYANSPYAWLFQPYMGEELVALSCHGVEHGVLSVAAVPFTQRTIKTSDAYVMTLLPSEAAVRQFSLMLSQRQHQLQHVPQRTEIMDETNLGELVAHIGNRPLLGWGLRRQLSLLNQALNTHLDFTLPNAQVDLDLFNRRELQRRQPCIDPPVSLRHAAARFRIPLYSFSSLLDQASASALLYQRLQRLTD
ncbi:DNA polymerase III subunit epsilon [Halomonas vilamensis]|uniref:DNA polymerase III subunit epsilon n=1 Tax=Vreelandella vilamensis TaxID=531309 RepID=A0ABU1H161_9GAMM|nr:DNA polymerase III subunit epsilon [Halomonas vilamensis]MDR5897497.1 DNA polymerase III subunit epsilon [Halomonas vilamensis]